MIAVALLFIMVSVSLLVTRVGAVAFRLTGMSNGAACFQARSAHTGAGFTTNESEQILMHPVRSRIVGVLLLLGNIALIAASGTLILSLVGIEGRGAARRIPYRAGADTHHPLAPGSGWRTRFRVQSHGDNQM